MRVLVGAAVLLGEGAKEQMVVSWQQVEPHPGRRLQVGGLQALRLTVVLQETLPFTRFPSLYGFLDRIVAKMIPDPLSCAGAMTTHHTLHTPSHINTLLTQCSVPPGLQKEALWRDSL